MKPLPRRKKRYEVTPAVINALGFPIGDNIETVVRIQKRVANPPFDTLSIEEGVALLRRLWPQHREAAVKHCVEHFPCQRPILWWADKERPLVRPRDWTLPGDGTRFEEERFEADLKYLQEHKCISAEELAARQASGAVTGVA